MYGTIAKGGIKFARSPLGSGVIGSGIGALGMWLYGSGKKGIAQEASQATETTTTTTTHAPSYQYDYSRIVSNIIESPGASIDTKKGAMEQTPSTAVAPSVAVSPSLSQKATGGTDLVTLALIGGAAVVAHGYITKK